MKKIKFCLLGVLSLIVFANFQTVGQTDKVCFSINDIQGIIFLEGGSKGLGQLVTERRPVSVDEVLRIDSLAYLYLEKRFTDVLPQQGYDNCPVISESWKDYHRQIINYKDKKSNTEVLWIQYVHKNMLDEHTDWKDNWVLASGGCSNYWQIKYNRKSKTFFDFVIN